MVRSARTLRSMAALVSVVVERRARAHASGWAAGRRRRRPRAVLVRRLAGLERGAPRHAVGGERRPLSRAN
jgi:hypothetical protein